MTSLLNKLPGISRLLGTPSESPALASASMPSDPRLVEARNELTLKVKSFQDFDRRLGSILSDSPEAKAVRQLEEREKLGISADGYHLSYQRRANIEGAYYLKTPGGDEFCLRNQGTNGAIFLYLNYPNNFAWIKDGSVFLDRLAPAKSCPEIGRVAPTEEVEILQKLSAGMHQITTILEGAFHSESTRT